MPKKGKGKGRNKRSAEHKNVFESSDEENKAKEKMDGKEETLISGLESINMDAGNDEQMDVGQTDEANLNKMEKPKEVEEGKENGKMDEQPKEAEYDEKLLEPTEEEENVEMSEERLKEVEKELDKVENEEKKMETSSAELKQNLELDESKKAENEEKKMEVENNSAEFKQNSEESLDGWKKVEKKQRKRTASGGNASLEVFIDDFGNGGFSDNSQPEKKRREEGDAVKYLVCQVHETYVVAGRLNKFSHKWWPYFVEIADKLVKKVEGENEKELMVGDEIWVTKFTWIEETRRLASRQEDVEPGIKFWLNNNTKMLPRQAFVTEFVAIRRAIQKEFVGCLIGIKMGKKTKKFAGGDIISCGLQICSRFNPKQNRGLDLENLKIGQLINVCVAMVPEGCKAEDMYILPPGSPFCMGTEHDVLPTFGVLCGAGPHPMQWPSYHPNGLPMLFPCSAELNQEQLMCVEHVVAAATGYEMELEQRKMLAARFEGRMTELRNTDSAIKLSFGERKKEDIRLLSECWEADATIKARTTLADKHFAQGTVCDHEIIAGGRPNLFVFSVWVKLTNVQQRRNQDTENEYDAFINGARGVVHPIPGKGLEDRLACFKYNMPSSIARMATPQGRIMAALLGRSTEQSARMRMEDVDDENDGIPEGAQMHEALRRLNGRQRATAQNLLQEVGTVNHQQAPGGTGKTEVAAAALKVSMDIDPDQKCALMACSNIPVTKLVEAVRDSCGQRLDDYGSMALFGGVAKVKYASQIDRVSEQTLKVKANSAEFKHSLNDEEKKIVDEYLKKVEDKPRFAGERAISEVYTARINPKVIFCTSAMGEDLLDGCLQDTKVLIFDESTQAKWAVIVHLVAKMDQLEKLLLTGDRHQLGVHLADLPTILQTNYGLESVLEQLECSPGVRYTFLTKCYRSHPTIVECVSFAKYEPDEKLIPATSAEDRNFLTNSQFPLPVQNVPIVLINSTGFCRQDPTGPSLTNDDQTDGTVMLVDALEAEFGPNVLKETVVLCMYLFQVAELRAAFQRRGTYEGLQIVSVDAFQSQEANFVILVTSRTRNRDRQVNGGWEFFKDDRRACVALTRARHGLFLLGDLVNISQGEVWRKFITKALEFSPVVKDAYCAAVRFRTTIRQYGQMLHDKNGPLDDHAFLREWNKFVAEERVENGTEQDNANQFRYADAVRQPVAGPSNANERNVRQDWQFGGNAQQGGSGNAGYAQRGGRTWHRGGGQNGQGRGGRMNNGGYRGSAKNQRGGRY